MIKNNVIINRNYANHQKIQGTISVVFKDDGLLHVKLSILGDMYVKLAMMPLVQNLRYINIQTKCNAPAINIPKAHIFIDPQDTVSNYYLFIDPQDTVKFNYMVIYF